MSMHFVRFGVQSDVGIIKRHVYYEHARHPVFMKRRKYDEA
jgi:hypothetical protein